MITRPMLAGKVEDLAALRYPVMASPKLDGVRLLRLHDGRIVTRKFKPLPNRYTRDALERLLPPGIDGEVLIADKQGRPAPFNAVQSALMSEGGEPVFVFSAFDLVTLGDGLEQRFEDRYGKLRKVHGMAKDENRANGFVVVPHVMVQSPEELLEFEAKQLARGFEGVMVRDPAGPYKCGRSTNREGWLLKLKRFDDAEAEVIGVEERMHNANEKQRDAFGLAKRSSHKVNQVPTGTLGALVVRTEEGVEFRIGSGFTEAQRAEFWAVRESLAGKLVTYKSQPTGEKDAPRFPVFKGFRDPADMS